MYTYNYLVFIGRFQPFHNGHMHVIKEALKLAERVIVLIGSANSSRRPRNPFTFDERLSMIRRSILDEMRHSSERVIIRGIDDFPYNENRWIKQVQSKVDSLVGDLGKQINSRTSIGLIGHIKDSTSFYLKEFPQWALVEVKPYKVMNATDIRAEFLKVFYRIPETYHVPAAVKKFLESFPEKNALDFQWLLEYHNACVADKESWKAAPWPVNIMCADNVVIQSGHILLVERAGPIGRGLLALPGGHVGVKETFRAGAIRELREETHMADEKGELPPGMLNSFITKEQFFDDPERSERGRVATMAYYYELPVPKDGKLFEVRGDDDAQFAKWHPLSSLEPTKMFEDHYHIIDEMVGGL